MSDELTRQEFLDTGIPGTVFRIPVLCSKRTKGGATAEAWRWSSAASHIAGERTGDDPLTNVVALGQHFRNWRAMLTVGL